MKKHLLSCLLLGLLSSNYVATAQATNIVTTSLKAAPSQAYFQLASEVADLLKRASTLSDEKALSLLRRESPSLQLRAKQVKPAYQNWLRSLSVPEQKAEDKRIATSPWGRYFADLDPKLGAKIGRNKAIGQQVMYLMSLFEGV
ncbi:MAG: hypothetical protein EOO61_18555 [Hymenobacter sp.]|nr:MAG: hypothetical protein EOO61_18555 [Hymenobacter sp.]